MTGVSKSTSHREFVRWQSPVLLALLALRLGVKIVSPQRLDLRESK
jgi:hypothetical protein